MNQCKTTQNTASSMINSDISDDEGQIGVVVVNTETRSNSGSFNELLDNGKSKKRISLHASKQHGKRFPVNNHLVTNILRVIKNLKTAI